MSEQFGFKSAFRGFDRADVLAYIDGLRTQLRETEERYETELQAARQETAEAAARLAEVAVAEQTAAERAVQLAETETENAGLREEVERLNAALAEAQAAATAGDEVQSQLADVRADLAASRGRESELTAQLAETHQAVAALWQEKEAMERKLSAAATFVDNTQALAMEFKAALGTVEEVAEKPAEKPMERWLF